MIGLYPVTPGFPVYDIASPAFDSVVIRLPKGGAFVIEARHNSPDGKYLQSITLNGKPISRVWLRHAGLVDGGTLVLEMGSTPNRQLGFAAADEPPDAMNLDPESFTGPTPER